MGYTPLFLPLLYLILSLFTYLIYAKDKKAAQNNQWRTPEKNLHLYAVLGGWPGAIIAQQTLRHKSQKRNFRVVFFMTLLINITLLATIHSAAGNRFILNSTYKLQNFITQNIQHPQTKKSMLFMLECRKTTLNIYQNTSFYIRAS